MSVNDGDKTSEKKVGSMHGLRQNVLEIVASEFTSGKLKFQERYKMLIEKLKLTTAA